MSFVYVFITIVLTVYTQLVMKWQASYIGNLNFNTNKVTVFFLLLLNPWLISGLIAAFLALISWMLALSKLELSYAYPFLSLSFVSVMLCNAIIFNEPLSVAKILGIILIALGIALCSSTKGMLGISFTLNDTLKLLRH